MFGPGDNSNNSTAPENTARVARSIMLKPSTGKSLQISPCIQGGQKIVLDTLRCGNCEAS
jgi:hypothetical protein